MGIAHRTFILSLLLVTSAAAQNWEKLGGGENVSSPGEVFGHTLVWDETHSQLILFGGKDKYGSVINTLWIWDPETSLWTSPPLPGNPTARAFMTAVWNNDKEQMIIYGGKGYGETGFGPLDQVRAYDPSTSTWMPITFDVGTGPRPRSLHAAVYDPQTKRMFSFGGEALKMDGTLEIQAQTWALAYNTSNSKWEWTPREPMPSALAGHTAVFDAVKRRVYVYGGFTQDSVLSNIVYAYDIDNNSWSRISDSGGRAIEFHSAAWDPRNQQMLIYGGGNGQTAEESFQTFRLPRGTWETLVVDPHPGSRMAASSAWDGRALYIYGGLMNGDEDGELLMAPPELWKYTPGESATGGSLRENANGDNGINDLLCGVATAPAGGMTLLVAILIGVVLAASSRR